jgi:trehalose/maltose hydrolase-like predicted phosphorylase
LSTIARDLSELEPTADPAWVIADDASDPVRASSREARFTTSNGAFAARCPIDILQDAPLARPRVYVAGLFDTVADRPPSSLVAAPDWLRLRIAFHVTGSESDPLAAEHRRTVLDLRRGVIFSDWQLTAGAAVLRVRAVHFVSLRNRAVGLQVAELRIESGDATASLAAIVDERALTLIPETLEDGVGVWRTEQSGKRLAMAVASSLTLDGRLLEPTAVERLSASWEFSSEPGQVSFFERRVAIALGNDRDATLARSARNELAATQRLGWKNVLERHETAWALRWDQSDVVVRGDPAAQRALRFALFSLNGVVNPDDDRVSIGARALTGEDYAGHVFWDTEIYLLPFYIMTWPEAARALLMYRYHTLDGARAKARGMGCGGALYAWESADTGEETTPSHVVAKDGKVIEVLSGTQEQHISADIAYAVWQYWQAVRDERFLLDAGAEILLETARFWAGRATREADGRRHIRGVIGPDEYHEHIDDSAFTNVMARWNLRRGIEVAALLHDRWPARWTELRAHLGLSDSEVGEWGEVADTIVTGLDPETGLFEEFAGYFALEYIDLADYADRTMPMDVVLGRPRTQRSQVIKQADVVALLALLPEEFVGDAAAANFDFYEPRCDHGSSLSRGLHAMVAARLGDLDIAKRYFESAAAIDLSDERPSIGGGVHIAAQGGIWLAAVFGFSGLSLRDDGLAVDPRLPAGWEGLKYAVQWRGRKLEIDVDALRDRITVTLHAGDPMRIYIGDGAFDVRSDVPIAVRLPS